MFVLDVYMQQRCPCCSQAVILPVYFDLSIYIIFTLAVSMYTITITLAARLYMCTVIQLTPAINLGQAFKAILIVKE